MNGKFDEEAFLKATSLGEETAVKDAEVTERESQRSSDEKQKIGLCQRSHLDRKPARRNSEGFDTQKERKPRSLRSG
jgi:PBP1b-binding outer membrane lipoprotein LpoB